MDPFNKPSPYRLSSQVIGALTKIGVLQGPTTERRLSKGVAELSRLFTVDRSRRPADYLERPEYAAAYLGYFLPVNLAKVQVLLEELPTVTWQEDGQRPLSVLDLGIGPGTGALAFLDWAHRTGRTAGRPVHVVGVDRSQRALHDASRLWQTYVDENRLSAVQLRLVHADVEKRAGGPFAEKIERGKPFDLVILANCLNELFASAREALVQRMKLVVWAFSLLKPTGACMIVEPALRGVARQLHVLRDRLLEEQLCTVYSPCLHELTCPALIRPDDWCHEERPWEAPTAIQAIDREVGFIKDALKFSYLLLRTDGLTIAPRCAEVYRVVSELRKMKGEMRAWLCNETGRSEAGLLDRAASPSNAAFTAVQRGTIVRIDRLVRKEGRERGFGRIPPDGPVDIVRPL